MRVVFAASEFAPLAWSGGLGDAVAGLARALAGRGHEVICQIPAHRSARAGFAQLGRGALALSGETRVALPDRNVAGDWLDGAVAPGLTVSMWNAASLFDRPGLYGATDDALRFIAFSRAVAHRVEILRPDVLVAHDWHAALSIALLRTALDRGANRAIATVQAIHNNAYQGRFPAASMPLTGLPAEQFHPDGVEAWGDLCLLKGGTQFADRLVAVSPTYAREIQTAPFGEGLEGAYRVRAHRLTGIVNGIDVERFDPSADTALAAGFDARRPVGRALCRDAVLDQLGLGRPASGLFLAAIGRFAVQKGWDVIADSLDALVARGAAVALLGDGDPELAARLATLAAIHRGRVALRIGFDDVLARRLYAGADGVLVPSRFEPCGLVQRIAQRYGALPIAHATGGLVDTIVDPEFDAAGDAPANLAARRRATGLLFAPLDPRSLIGAVERMIELGASGELPRVQKRLLGLDVSWKRPALEWESVLVAAHREALTRL